MGDRIKLGYAPTRRFVFSKEDAHKYKNLILEKISEFDIEIIDLEGINKFKMQK
ncbi:MAG: L-fucose isomerase-like protein [Pelosinus sp.]|nr:L-fucose isomerase-like protein [Pelosinus sp.]